ncbi:MAG: hypothetical protein ACHQF4_10325 [Sphingobacteriales bacterium]
MTKPFQYQESHKLPLNVFLAFYGYVIAIITLANVVPVSGINYSIFFILGFAGMFILFIRAAYKLTVRDNMLQVSITFLVKIVVLRVNLNEVESIEQLRVNNMASSFEIKRSFTGISYLAKIPTAVTLNMPGKKSYTISAIDPARLVNLVESLNK